MANRSKSSDGSWLPAHDATDSAMYGERERSDTSGSTGVPPLDPFLPFSENRQTDGALNRCDRDAHEQRPQTELKPAAFAHWRGGNGRLGWHGRIISDRGKAGQGFGCHREVVPLCPLKSDSRFNGPGLLQNQLRGNVDAAVVRRNSDA
jgi:hypothetical protein